MNEQALHQKAKQSQYTVEQAYQRALKHGFALMDQPIDTMRLKQGLMHSSCGALATFEGWVRDHNNTKTVNELTYYGYEALALNQGAKLVEQTKQRFDVVHAVAVHRIGELVIGDVAVWVGVVSAHRYPAFDACRWLLDAIKADIPIWKQEFYDNAKFQPQWLSNNG